MACVYFSVAIGRLAKHQHGKRIKDIDVNGIHIYKVVEVPFNNLGVFGGNLEGWGIHEEKGERERERERERDGVCC